MTNFNSQQTLIMCTLDDLRELFSECICNSSFDQINEGQKEEKYLNADEVMNVLHCNRSTLWRWGKNGILRTIKVGRNNLYKESDIQNLLEK